TRIDGSSELLDAFPEPLTIGIVRATSSPTVIALSAGSGLTIPATVTIPAGELSVSIPVDGITEGDVEVSATLAGSAAVPPATVQVLAFDQAPTGVTLSPNASPGALTLSVGAEETFTVTLDIPAPQTGGTVVTLTDTSGGT